MATSQTGYRCQWVDVAKGICIILVVMMHSANGVERVSGSETLLHSFINWARPFRMPDFFLISGLFLAARIDRPWRSYLDTKVLHFAYFYVLWVNIQLALRAPGSIAEHGLTETVEQYFLSYIEPFGTLWFIYLLAIFFVVSKLLNGVPKWAVIAAAALIHIYAPRTEWTVIDEFTDRFLFFYSGYAAAPYVFRFAERIAAFPAPAIAVSLALWAGTNELAVYSGVALTRGLGIVFSYAGIAAVIAFSVLLASRERGEALAYCGRNSIVIYLAFSLFMAPMRFIMLKLSGGHMLDVATLMSTAAGVIGPLILAKAVAGTSLDFLFKRPDAFKMPALEQWYRGVPRGSTTS